MNLLHIAQWVTSYSGRYSFVMRCAIWYHLHNLKNVKNTQRRSVTFNKFACNFTQSNTPALVFFTFFKLCKQKHTAQSISNVEVHDQGIEEASVFLDDLGIVRTLYKCYIYVFLQVFLQFFKKSKSTLAKKLTLNLSLVKFLQTSNFWINFCVNLFFGTTIKFISVRKKVAEAILRILSPFFFKNTFGYPFYYS